MARTRYQHLDGQTRLRELPGAALRAVLREGYDATAFKADVLAGVVVGVVALPLAMALSIAIGAPPQNGLYTAIVAGFLSAALGGSRTQVSGPTAAFIVILAPIVAEHGLGGLLMAGAMAGVLLVGMGLFRLGALIEFIPHPVTTGFTAGIATVIATLQLKDLFGLRLASNPAHYFEHIGAMLQARHSTSYGALAIGLGTLALLVGLPRVIRKVPAPLIALPLAALSALAWQHAFPALPIDTIASRFSTLIDGVVVPGVPRVPPLPMWPWDGAGPDGAPLVLSFALIRELLPSAFAIAMLGAIESLLSAVVADGMARTRHDPDAELVAIGVGNVAAAFFGGIPATGAIARTATNVRAGARSPVAAMVHSLTVLVVVLLLAPAIGYLPMAALAALLLLVAWNMSDLKHFVHTLHVAPKSDVAVLLTCYVLTVAIDMVVAVSVGIVLAAVLFMRRMASVMQVKLSEGQHAAIPRALPKGVIVYDISGPLFFGAAHKAMGALSAIADRAKVVVLRMDNVPVLDATGLVAFESALDRLAVADCLTLVVGLQPQPASVLDKAERVTKRAKLVRCPDTESALRTAEQYLAAQAARV